MTPRPFRDRISARRGKTDDGQDAWLITYADLITQLMCFFVLVLMISEPKLEKLGEITNALGSGFLPTKIETPYAALFTTTESWIAEHGIEVEATAEYSPRGVVIDFASDFFFEAGSVAPTSSAREKLAAWVHSMGAIPWQRTTLTVAGYTDDIAAPSGSPYVSAWALSAARAAAIAQLLAEQGVPEARIQITAYGKARPLVPNTQADGTPIPENRARNRRVLIRVERDA